MSRKLSRSLAASLLAALVAVPVPPAGAAAPDLAPAGTSVAAGSQVELSPTECLDGSTHRILEVVLITGSGAGEHLAAYGRDVGDGVRRVTVPGWVDPAQPALLAGRCIEATGGGAQTGPPPTFTTLFTYDDVPIDVTPGPPGTSGPTATLDRDAAEGGQIVEVDINGCPSDTRAVAFLLRTSDLSGRSGLNEITGAGVGGAAGTADLVLNGLVVHGLAPAPLPVGTYTVLAACGSQEDAYDAAFAILAEPHALEVTGTNATDTLSVAADDTEATVRGAGCPAGSTVTLRGRYRWLEDGDQLEGGKDETDKVLVAAPDGTWSHAYPLVPGSAWQVLAEADCGDPRADGFRYSEASGTGNVAGPGPTTPISTTPISTTPATAPTVSPGGSVDQAMAPGASALPGEPTYTG